MENFDIYNEKETARKKKWVLVFNELDYIIF